MQVYGSRPLINNIGGDSLVLRDGEGVEYCECGEATLRRPELEAQAKAAHPNIIFVCTACMLRHGQKI